MLDGNRLLGAGSARHFHCIADATKTIGNGQLILLDENQHIYKRDPSAMSASLNHINKKVGVMLSSVHAVLRAPYVFSRLRLFEDCASSSPFLMKFRFYRLKYQVRDILFFVQVI